MTMDRLGFNGIDARTGDYLLSLSPDELVALACGEGLDPEAVLAGRGGQRGTGEAHYGVTEGVDVRDLGQAGWGVVFPAARPDDPGSLAEQAAILEALQPLMALRQKQAGRCNERAFRVFKGPDGLRPNEDKRRFLARHGAGDGPANPEDVPYYLLLVGDPTRIPFRVQSLLSGARAVGRICFDTIEGYAQYARSVVEAESQPLVSPRRVTFFGVENADDRATRASARHLVEPLADALACNPRFAAWSVDRVIGAGATRDALGALLGSGDPPALLFTASHGLGFPNGDPQQIAAQGALLCQDWPGRKAWRGKPIPEEFYLAGHHLSADTSLLGTIAFLFACYGAGTPQQDEFARQAFKARADIAPRAFVAALPQAMLNRPKGGALAVIGHVERAWGHSFLLEGSAESGQARPQIAVFESALRSLMSGMPVGAAMEYFHARTGDLSSALAALVEAREFGEAVDEIALADLWTANNDARGYAILGDPAVRLGGA